MNPMEQEMDKVVSKLLPHLVEASQKMLSAGMNRGEINVPGGSWMFFGDNSYSLEHLARDLGAALQHEGRAPQVSVPDSPSYTPPAPSAVHQEMEAMLSDKKIEYADINALAKQYSKSKVEQLAARMGYKCDWNNNYLIKDEPQTS